MNKPITDAMTTDKNKVFSGLAYVSKRQPWLKPQIRIEPIKLTAGGGPVEFDILGPNPS